MSVSTAAFRLPIVKRLQRALHATLQSPVLKAKLGHMSMLDAVIRCNIIRKA